MIVFSWIALVLLKKLYLNNTSIRGTGWSEYGRELIMYGNIPGNEYILRVDNRNIRKMYVRCSKLTIKTTEQGQISLLAKLQACRV